MKLKKNSSTPLQISNTDPDLLYAKREVHYGTDLLARSPNTPTPEAVKKAQFVDKTYRWNGR